MNFDYLIHLAELGAIDIHPGGREATFALIDALDLHPRERILEIGCGTGGTLVRLPGHLDLERYAVELLPEMLAVASQRLRFTGLGRDIHLVQASGTALPFPGSFFKKIYTESVLGFQEISLVKEMLAEIYRVLEPGGLFAANEAIWKEQIKLDVVADINRTCEADFGLRQSTDRAWDIEDWLRAIHASGFHVHSASLLGEQVAKTGSAANLSPKRDPLPSWLLTMYIQLGGYLNPKIFKQHLCFQSRLLNHKDDGQFIEERLFVLQKND